MATYKPTIDNYIFLYQYTARCTAVEHLSLSYSYTSRNTRLACSYCHFLMDVAGRSHVTIKKCQRTQLAGDRSSTYGYPRSKQN